MYEMCYRIIRFLFHSRPRHPNLSGLGPPSNLSPRPRRRIDHRELSHRWFLVIALASFVTTIVLLGNAFSERFAYNWNNDIKIIRPKIIVPGTIYTIDVVVPFGSMYENKESHRLHNSPFYQHSPHYIIIIHQDVQDKDSLCSWQELEYYGCPPGFYRYNLTAFLKESSYSVSYDNPVEYVTIHLSEAMKNGVNDRNKNDASGVYIVPPFLPISILRSIMGNMGQLEFYFFILALLFILSIFMERRRRGWDEVVQDRMQDFIF